MEQEFLDVKSDMRSWGWRIKKAGHNLTTFGKLVGMSQPILGAYISCTKSPGVLRYEKIENKLRELGV